MITNSPSLDLVEFVETQILPRYADFDRAHNLEHVTRVIRRSLEMVKTTGADINMAYVIAAYHDLGMSGPRAVHHITGGKILANDARLKKWFSPEQIKASHSPRSLYGKIVAEADRDISVDIVIRRTIQYGLGNYPQLDKEGHWKRFKKHLDEKYSVNGYIRLWLPHSPNEKNLNELRQLIANPQELRKTFETIFTEETRDS